MARQDAGKWVARAGATGGGRSYRARVPYRWYSGLALIVVLGVFLVAYSRYERLHPVAAVQPTTSTHWAAGVVFDVCGKDNQVLVRELDPGPDDPRPLLDRRRSDPDPAEELSGRRDQCDARQVHLAVQSVSH